MNLIIQALLFYHLDLHPGYRSTTKIRTFDLNFKKYILSMLAICLATLSQAQSENAFTGTIANLTAKAKAISAEEYVTFSKKHFNVESTKLPGARYFENDDMQIVLQQRGTSKYDPFSFAHTIDFYKGMEKLSSKQKLLDAEVKTFGNSKYLIVHYRFGEDEFLSFFSELYSIDKYMFGILKCKPEDIPAARQLLQSVLPAL